MPPAINDILTAMEPHKYTQPISPQSSAHKILLGCFLVLAALGLIAGDYYQTPPENSANLNRGGQFYQAWDLILEVPLPNSQHPLWEKHIDPSAAGAQTWRCVACHGWDYLGRGDYPSLLKARAYSDEELIAWLDGSANPEHNFAQYLTIAALRDLVAFMQDGIVDLSRYRLANTIDLRADEVHGEALYKERCRSCHGADGARINFGSAQSPVFIGNIAMTEPFRITHVTRTGHLFLSIPTSDEFGWTVRDVVDLTDYTQALPQGQQIQLEALEEQRLDFSTQGDTTGLVLAAIGIMLVILLALGWYELNEFRRRG